MKIDWKNPIYTSLILLVVTSVITLISLYFIKPSFIISINNKGNKTINICSLLLYSVLFGCVVGIIVFLFRVKNDRPKKESFNFKNYYSIAY